jgi:antitoxin component HigA of HigAB toxin-antitoxin module
MESIIIASNMIVKGFVKNNLKGVDKRYFGLYIESMKIDINTVDARLKIVGNSRSDLAKALGVSRQRLSEMLLKSRSYNVVERLSHELSVPQRSLIDFEDGKDV